LIVSHCYDCAEPDIEVTEGNHRPRVLRYLPNVKSLHPDDTEDRELARYFKRA
jgi:hypothetical protein